jgi:hypothetical protein
MSRPTQAQIQAAAEILATNWDPDGTKAFGELSAYAEWGRGIADMIIHDPPSDALADYLGVLEGQIGVRVSSIEQRVLLAGALANAVRAAG